MPGMPEISDEEYAELLALRGSTAPSEEATTVVIEQPAPATINAEAAATVAIIEAQAEAEVKVIEARAAADTEVMEAAAAIENPPDDDDELFDSDGNARPENEHWFFRKINKK